MHINYIIIQKIFFNRCALQRTFDRIAVNKCGGLLQSIRIISTLKLQRTFHVLVMQSAKILRVRDSPLLSLCVIYNWSSIDLGMAIVCDCSF